MEITAISHNNPRIGGGRQVGHDMYPLGGSAVCIFFSLVFVAAYLLAVPVCAIASDSAPPAASLDYLKKWEGRYPAFDEQKIEDRPKGKRFWDDSNVRTMMRQNMPKKLIKDIVKDYQCGKIERRGDILFISTCRPHFCETDAARLYFNLAKKSVQVCRTETHVKAKEIDIVDYWIDKKVRKLGSDACSQNERFAGYEAFADKDY